MILPLAFFTDSMGFGELFFIFIVILVLFGPRRLPEIARQIGRTMNDLRRASQDFKDQIMQLDQPTPPPPTQLDEGPSPWGSDVGATEGGYGGDAIPSTPVAESVDADGVAVAAHPVAADQSLVPAVAPPFDASAAVAPGPDPAVVPLVAQEDDTHGRPG